MPHAQMCWASSMVRNLSPGPCRQRASRRFVQAPNSKRPKKLWRIKPYGLSDYSWCCVSSYIALPESIYVDLSPWLSRSPILASPCLPSSWSSKPAHGIHLQQSVSPALPSWLHCLSISMIKQAASRMEVWRPAPRCRSQGVNSWFLKTWTRGN